MTRQYIILHDTIVTCRADNGKGEKMNITDYISDTPISRQELCALTGLSDRKVRAEIAKAKLETPICNIGEGYFIPNNPDDPRLRQYVFQEMSRGKEIFRGVMSCRMLMNEDTKQERLNI